MEHCLRVWLRKKNKSVEELAGEVGTSTSTIFRLIAGSHETSTRTIRLISEATGFALTEEQIFADFIIARDRRAREARGKKTRLGISVSCGGAT